MEQAIILQAMLDKAKEHNLEMECLISLINDLIGVTDEELQQACENALCSWDI